jgi:hypothetical protein
VKNFVTIELFKAFSRVKYYTFHIEGRDRSETDTFFSTYEKDDELADDLNTLVTWMTEIGQKKGKKTRYFRPENRAEALPPPARIMAELTVNTCNLRLYCFRLSDEVVILANGGRKVSDAVQDSPDAYPKFQFANRMAQQLLKLIQERGVDIQGKDITNLEDIELWD